MKFLQSPYNSYHFLLYCGITLFHNREGSDKSCMGTGEISLLYLRSSSDSGNRPQTISTIIRKQRSRNGTITNSKI